jgi:hypothetical protein
MSVDLLGAKVDGVGRVIFDADPIARKIFFNLVYETTEGAEFLKQLSPTAIARLAESLEAKFILKNRNVLVEDAVRVIRDLLVTKDPALFPPQPEPATPATDDRPRNADGTFKSEYQTWSENHSSAECAERARQDSAGYGEWRRSQFQAQGLQPGTFTLAGLPERPAMDDERRDLADFVRAYNAAPAQSTRPRGGFVVLDEAHHYTAAEFEQLLSRASRVGLI